MGKLGRFTTYPYALIARYKRGHDPLMQRYKLDFGILRVRVARSEALRGA